jgi:hypothetical protein
LVSLTALFAVLFLLKYGSLASIGSHAALATLVNRTHRRFGNHHGRRDYLLQTWRHGRDSRDFGVPSNLLNRRRFIGFFIEPDIEIRSSPHDRPLDMPILKVTQHQGSSVRVRPVIMSVRNKPGKLSATAKQLRAGLQVYGDLGSFKAAWISGYLLQRSIVGNDFDLSSAEGILEVLGKSLSIKTSLNRGVSKDIMIGFSLESTGKFYFVGIDPFEAREAEFDPRVTNTGGLISSPYFLVVEGPDISAIQSKTYRITGTAWDDMVVQETHEP